MASNKWIRVVFSIPLGGGEGLLLVEKWWCEYKNHSTASCEYKNQSTASCSHGSRYCS